MSHNFADFTVFLAITSKRRLKTWLRNTLSQPRLNHNSICNNHKEMLDELDLGAILNDFTSRSDIRKRQFGISKFEVTGTGTSKCTWSSKCTFLYFSLHFPFVLLYIQFKAGNIMFIH